jgi:hypothetical protein
MVIHVLARQWIEWGPMARQFVGGALANRTIVAVYRIFSQKLPFFAQIPESAVEGFAALIVIPAAEKLKSSSNLMFVVLAAICAIQYRFFTEPPLPPDFIKEAAPHSNTEAFTAYLKPLEKLEPGKVNYVFAQTYLSLPYLAKSVAQMFPDKKVYWVERKEDLDVFLAAHPKSIVLSNIPGVFKDVPKETICCEIFSNPELAYSHLGCVRLGPLDEKTCLDQCGFAEDRGSQAFHLVQTLENIPTTGSLSVDELKAQEGDIEVKAIAMLTTEKGMRPHQLISIYRELGLPYVPQKVTKPSCLGAHCKPRPAQNEDTQQINNALGQETSPHVIFGGKSDKELTNLALQLNKPGWTVCRWDMKLLFMPKEKEGAAQLNPNALDHLLDYLWNNPKTILFTQLTHSRLSFLQLLPPETYILMGRPQPLKKGQSLGELEGWFQYLGPIIEEK